MRKRRITFAAVLLTAILVLPLEAFAAKPEMYVATNSTYTTVYSNVVTATPGITAGMVSYYSRSGDYVYLEYQDGASWYSSGLSWGGGSQPGLAIGLPANCLGKPLRLRLTTYGSTYSGTYGRLLLGSTVSASGITGQWSYTPYVTVPAGKRIVSVYADFRTGGDSTVVVAGQTVSAYCWDEGTVYQADVIIPVGPPLTQVCGQIYKHPGASSAWVNVYTAVQTTDILMPNAPSVSVSWDETNQRVSLTWGLVQDATSYEIWRDGVLLQTVSGYSSTAYDTAPPRGTTVTYVVKAVNYLGSRETTRTYAVPPATPVSAPAVCWSASPLGVGLSWDAIPGATTYRIWRNGSQVGTSPAAAYVDTSAGRNMVYEYKIQAGNSSGFSLQGPGASMRTPPAPPAWTSCGWSNSTYRVDLVWKVSSGAAKYGVYRNGAKIAETTDLFYYDSSAPRGTIVQYELTSFSSGGFESEKTYVCSAGTAPECPPITSLQTGSFTWSSNPDDPGRGFIALSWDPVSGATKYVVEVHDGYTWAQVQSGPATSWDSRATKIYPPETWLNSQGNNSRDSLWNQGGDPLDLRDTPIVAYQKTVGTTYDGTNSYMVRVYAHSLYLGYHNLYSEYTPVQTVALDNRTDYKAPAVSDLTINGGQLVTSTPVVTVGVVANDPLQANWTVSTADDASGLKEICFSNDGAAWSAYEPFGGTITKEWLLPGDTTGLKTVYAKVKDVAGNETVATEKINFFLVDSMPPKVKAEVIGGPVLYTHDVTLKLEVSDDTTPLDKIQARYSNDNLTWTAWTPYTPTKGWTLLAGDGDKAVYIQAKDLANNYGSAVVTCVLKTSGTAVGSDPAVVTSLTGASGMYKNGGEEVLVRYTRNPEVRIKVDTTERVRYSFDNMTWTAETTALPDQTVTLADWDGYKTLYVRTQSGSTYVQRYVLDSTPPKVNAWWLGGATVAPGGAATVVVEAQDNLTPPSQLEVSFDGGVTWQPYASSKSLTLTGSGYVVLVVQVRDQSGNVTQKTLEILIS